MSTKTIDDARVKATEVVGQHELEFYALAFSRAPDKQGDRIHPRALDGWLERFYAAAKPLPISFHHAAMRGESAGDPFSVIGYAPADRDHVWVDDYGLRVRAILETEINDKAEQVYRLAKRGVLTGASAVFMVPPSGERKQKDGSTLIMEIPDVREAGPTLAPANDDAYVLSVKAEIEAEMKAVDNADWDGGQAMAACSTAADYRSICAGERTSGEPDERQHWALPHHYLGRGPNAGGVRNALSRLPQTQGLSNRDAAQSHLERHMSEINPERAASANSNVTYTDTTTNVDYTVLVDVPVSPEMREKAGRVISAATAKKLHAMRETIEELLALVEKDGDEEPEAKSAGPNDWVREELAKYDPDRKE